MTRDACENALVIVIALGGLTNAVLHLMQWLEQPMFP